MDFDAANNSRNAQLRWNLLRMLNAARAMEGGINGETLRAQIDSVLPPSRQFADADHAFALLVDLSGAGYVELIDHRTEKRQRYTLEWANAKITAKGTAFCERHLPADPMIDDGRIAPPNRGTR
jgi:hypothetical protein